jgi:hypothetical protein
VLVDQARAHVTALDANLPVLNARKLSEHMKALLLFNLAATMLYLAGRHGARGDGHLRAGLVHRQAEHARNRHPHALGAFGLSVVRGSWTGWLGSHRRR